MKAAHQAFRRPATPASGVPDPRRPDVLNFTASFDRETFAQIRARAVREGTSVAYQIRLLVEWGLEAEGARR